MEAGRQRRTEVIETLMGLHDDSGRHGLRVATFMRSLPPHHQADFKTGLRDLIKKTQQAVENELAERVVDNEM